MNLRKIIVLCQTVCLIQLYDIVSSIYLNIIWYIWGESFFFFIFEQYLVNLFQVPLELEEAFFNDYE